MRSLARHLRAHYIGYVALFVALGGTSYAAVSLPPNSITTREVKNYSLQTKDFKRGQLPRGQRGPAGPPGAIVASVNGRAHTPAAPPDTLFEIVEVTTTRSGRLFVYGHVESLTLNCVGGPCSVDLGLYVGDNGIPHTGRTLTSTCGPGGCKIETGQHDFFGMTNVVPPGKHTLTLCTRVRTGSTTAPAETGGEIGVVAVGAG